MTGNDDDVFEQIVGEASDRVLLPDRSQQSFCIALILGGAAAAQGALGLLPGDGRFTKDALERATETCSLALLAIWLGKMDSEDRTETDRARARREWAAVLEEAFGDDSKRLHGWFINVDAQYQHDSRLPDSDQPKLFFFASLVTDKCIETLGGQEAQTPSGGFPYQSLKDYRERGGGELTCYDPVAVMAMLTNLSDANEFSLQFYNEMIRGAH